MTPADLAAQLRALDHVPGPRFKVARGWSIGDKAPMTEGLPTIPAPTHFPHFPWLRRVPRRGKPNPYRYEVDRLRATQLAWLRDVGGMTPYRIAQLVYGRSEPGPGSVAAQDRNKKDVERWSASGREYLHRLGVGPWALWEDGAVPKRWWADARWYAALERWQDEAIVEMVERTLDHARFATERTLDCVRSITPICSVEAVVASVSSTYSRARQVVLGGTPEARLEARRAQTLSQTEAPTGIEPV